MIIKINYFTLYEGENCEHSGWNEYYYYKDLDFYQDYLLTGDNIMDFSEEQLKKLAVEYQSHINYFMEKYKLYEDYLPSVQEQNINDIIEEEDDNGTHFLSLKGKNTCNVVENDDYSCFRFPLPYNIYAGDPPFYFRAIKRR